MKVLCFCNKNKESDVDSIMLNGFFFRLNFFSLFFKPFHVIIICSFLLVLFLLYIFYILINQSEVVTTASDKSIYKKLDIHIYIINIADNVKFSFEFSIMCKIDIM